MWPVVPHQGMIQHEETPGSNEGNERSLFYSHPPLDTDTPLAWVVGTTLDLQRRCCPNDNLWCLIYKTISFIYIKCTQFRLVLGLREERQNISCQRIGTWHVMRRKTVVTLSIRLESSSYLRLTSYMWSGCFVSLLYTTMLGCYLLPPE